MPRVHFRVSVTVTRTNVSERPERFSNASSEEEWQKAVTHVAETKRNHWPVLVQMHEYYTACNPQACGHCRHNVPAKEFTEAQCRTGDGAPLARVVRQELFQRP